jgi:hypothetical protein
MIALMSAQMGAANADEKTIQKNPPFGWRSV